MERMMNLYTMDLFSRDRIRDDMLVYRVPGGWIYELLGDDDSTTAVFVPWKHPYSFEDEQKYVDHFARRRRTSPPPARRRTPL